MLFMRITRSLKKYPLPNKQFSWLWYYAMQQMGDDDAKQHATATMKKLRLREDVSNTIALPVPTILPGSS